MKRFFIVTAQNRPQPVPNAALMGDALVEQVRIRKARTDHGPTAGEARTTLPDNPNACPLLARVKARFPLTLPLLQAMAAAHLPLPCPVREVPFMRLMSLHQMHDEHGHAFVTLRFQRMGTVPATRSTTMRLCELHALVAGKPAAEVRNVRH